MGAAIRHATAALKAQRSSKKLLLVITDGEPADVDVRDPRYLRHDTKKAVEEAGRNGVTTYCMSLDTRRSVRQPHLRRAQLPGGRQGGAAAREVASAVRRIDEVIPVSMIHSRTSTYAGLDQEENHGMTMTGRAIRDAWVFGLLSEGDSFAGKLRASCRPVARVHLAWEPHGQLPSHLPPDLAKRHARIHGEAIRCAKAGGWSAALGDDD
ncbi:MAG: hypothetical protein R3E56_03935 [Burkholderiaceae bacterium]